MHLQPTRASRTGALLSGILAFVVVLPVAGCRGPGRGLDAQKEIEFGLRSARAGLWNEALYRFERAAKLRPEDAALCNNLAVAYEHEGRYDDAEREYERASSIAPENEAIRKNVEAFRSFRAGKRVEPDAASGADAKDDASPPPTQAAGASQPDAS